MGTKTLRLNQFQENMLDTLLIVNGEENLNKTICEAIKYQYEEDECIKEAQEEFKKGFKIYVQNFVPEQQRINIKQVAEKVLDLAERMIEDNKSNVLTEIVNIKAIAEEYLETITEEEPKGDDEVEDNDKIVRLNRMEALIRNLVKKGIFNDIETGTNVIIQLCDLVTPTHSCLSLMMLHAHMGENAVIQF